MPIKNKLKPALLWIGSVLSLGLICLQSAHATDFCARWMKNDFERIQNHAFLNTGIIMRIGGDIENSLTWLQEPGLPSQWTRLDLERTGDACRWKAQMHAIQKDFRRWRQKLEIIQTESDRMVRERRCAPAVQQEMKKGVQDFYAWFANMPAIADDLTQKSDRLVQIVGRPCSP
jgi:hypothetical protein